MHGSPLTLRLVLAGALALAALAGCDSGPGGQPLGGIPPTVSGFAYSPDAVLFDTLGVEGDTARIALALQVRAQDEDGAVARVPFVVEGQFGGTVARGELEPQGEGVYAGTTELVLARAQRGRYTVLVYAVDDEGLLGNTVRGRFDFLATGLGPPVIDAIEGPAEFRPPGTLRFVAVVSDPDGLADIARVEVTVPAGGTFPLVDDGRTFGDEAAGDGRYTAAFDVPEAAPGPQTFVFRAFDRDGAQSEEVPFTVIVLE